MRSSKLRDDILSWLVEEGLEVQKGPVPSGAPVEWALLVRVPAPLIVNITIQKPKDFNKIALTMVVKLSPEHLQAFRNRPPKERAKLIAEILIDMLKICPQCIVVNQPPKLDETEALIATREIIEEGLKKEVIVESIRTLANVYQLVVLKISSVLEPIHGSMGSLTM